VTNNDFNEWLQYHVRAFPAVGDWLKKHPDTVEFWANPFGDVNLVDAKAATDAMAAGRIEDPRGYSKHPVVIARHAKELRRASVRQMTGPDGERTYSCPICLDEGQVGVVNPVHWKAGRFRECFVYCTCPEGDRKQNRVSSDGRRARIRPRFDHSRMFKWNLDVSMQQLRSEFEQWLAGGAF